uniref:G-protein coupled receptors family 1 profile domain-containing protein n=1 Tax=Leptobrachium leishanense TaxID=445787 RepID=A0A8C5MWF7_9ANUR
MNSTTNTTSISGHFRETVKACIYLVDFFVCSSFTILIMQTILRDAALKKEIRFFFLCNHLVSLSLFFGFGTIFVGIRAFRFNVPVLACWIIFAVQIVIGRTLLMTLALMALNTCIAVCWPLKYLAFIHSAKCKLIVCMWIIAIISPLSVLIYESATKSPKQILKLDPTCPSGLTSLASRIEGVIFMFLGLSLIAIFYILLYREGRRSGHFNNSNVRARRTIIIHGIQIVFHVLPVIVNVILIGKNAHVALDLMCFIIFSLAQCLSPVVYGLRCSELRSKLIERQHCFIILLLPGAN